MRKKSVYVLLEMDDFKEAIIPGEFMKDIVDSMFPDGPFVALQQHLPLERLGSTEEQVRATVNDIAGDLGHLIPCVITLDGFGYYEEVGSGGMKGEAKEILYAKVDSKQSMAIHGLHDYFSTVFGKDWVIPSTQHKAPVAVLKKGTAERLLPLLNKKKSVHTARVLSFVIDGQKNRNIKVTFGKPSPVKAPGCVIS